MKAGSPNSRPSELLDESLSDQDAFILGEVDSALSRGVQLKQWWERTDAASAYRQRFELARSFNNSDTSFGFFDVAPIDGREVGVMGDVEERIFDRPKSSST